MSGKMDQMPHWEARDISFSITSFTNFYGIMRKREKVKGEKGGGIEKC